MSFSWLRVSAVLAPLSGTMLLVSADRQYLLPMLESLGMQTLAEKLSYERNVEAGI